MTFRVSLKSIPRMKIYIAASGSEIPEIEYLDPDQVKKEIWQRSGIAIESQIIITDSGEQLSTPINVKNSVTKG